MTFHHAALLLLLSFWAWQPPAPGKPSVPVPLATTCNQTFSNATGLVTAITNAANGTTICLNSGSYGALSFSGVARTGYVTVKSTTGVGGVIGTLTLSSNSRFIRFESLTIDDTTISTCARELYFKDIVFTGWWGLSFWGQSCGSFKPYNVTVDGGSIRTDQGAGVSEGAFDLRDDPSGGGTADAAITIKGVSIGGTGSCTADGIQLTGNLYGLTIGPGNVFHDIRDDITGSTGIHCDSIQLFGDGDDILITGNWFRDGAVVCTCHTGTPNGVSFVNNVIDNMAQLQVEPENSDAWTFEHNTVYNLTDLYLLHTLTGATILVRNNISMGTTIGMSTTGGGATVSYTACQTSGQCSGTNQTICTPTFVGGANPSTFTTFAQWQLTGTCGVGNAHDGSNRGTLYYGS